MKRANPQPTFGILTLSLPGPNRKRSTALYQYRVTYRNPTPSDPGCVMTWEATGGRLPYQVALERTARGDHLWHCSCADAVYRGGDYPTHKCKHVRAISEFVLVLSTPIHRLPEPTPNSRS